MLGFWRCRRLMGPPNGGLFHGALEAGHCLLVERFCSPGGWRGLSGGGRVPFASGSEALFVGGRVPFAHTLFIHGAALTANVSGALPAAPPTPPAPGQQNRRLCRFPRLHFLASGRSGYGILPFPTSGPDYSAHPWASPLRGRRKRRSKALPALLSMRG